MSWIEVTTHPSTWPPIGSSVTVCQHIVHPPRRSKIVQTTIGFMRVTEHLMAYNAKLRCGPGPVGVSVHQEIIGLADLPEIPDYPAQDPLDVVVKRYWWRS